ncbi:MAG: MerR family transcriptional regulator [Thermodesulfobacteriota bacterium]
MGQLARIAGVSVQTLRYYEKWGLVSPCGRNASGYRIYDEKALNRLRFIGRTKGLGFTLAEIKILLSIDVCTLRTCKEVRLKVLAKMMAVEGEIRDLTTVRDSLQKLADSYKSQCVSKKCPLLRELYGQ